MSGRARDALPRLPLLAVLLATVVGAALRLPVAAQGIFADELSTWWIATAKSFGGVLSTVHSDAEITPPLSFAAGWLSTRVHESPEVLRSPSLVAGVLTIPVVYLVGRRTVGQVAACVAAAFTALAPFPIYYSAEARGYALMMFLTALSTLCMLVAADSDRRRWWAAYALSSCAAMYTHYTSAFVLVAQLAWLAWAHPGARRPALVANAAAAVAYLPWIGGLRADLDSPTTKILSSISSGGGGRLALEHWSVGYPYGIVTLRELPGRPALAALALAVAIAAGALALRGRLSERLRGLGRDRGLLLVAALLLATPVGETVLGLFSTDLFSARNLAGSWPAFALALAALVAAAGPRLRYATIALALAALSVGAVKMLQPANGRPQFEKATDYVASHSGPRDAVIDEAVVLSPGPVSPIDIYLRRPLRVFRSIQPAERDHPFGVYDRRLPRPEAAAQALRAVPRGGRVWLITYASAPPPPGALRRQRLVRRLTYAGLVDLDVWEFRKVRPG